MTPGRRFVTPAALLPVRDGLLAWRELANKLRVYRLVRHAGAEVGLPPPGRPLDLPALVERAYALGEYAALWAVEGLGHDYAVRRWPAAGPAPRDLLTEGAAAGLPAASLTMLHAGLGLAFAERLLGELPRAAPEDRLRRTVAEVLRLCRANARPGYAGAAVESLGLVTRFFHGRRVAAVNGALRALGEEAAREWFWHGVGRCLYFLPVCFVPVGDVTWRPFRMARREAPDGAALANAVAGLGWAVTLVNMRQPAVMDRRLLARHGDELTRLPGFANGVASALLVRQDTTPGTGLAARFLAARASAEGWEPLVREPARRALRDLGPRLRDEGRLEDVFRVQPWIGRASR